MSVVVRMDVLDKGYVELLDTMGDDMAIVNAARVSYLGDSKGEVADKKLLFYLIEHGHTTPFEMVEFKFRVKCPLFVRSQWMRHRTWSYNEISRRYTSEDIDFYRPDEWRVQSATDKQSSDPEYSFSDLQTQYFNNQLEKVIDMAVEKFEKLIEYGVAREMARMVLPQNMYTTFIAKVDAHNLMHFLKLRMDSHAQYEIRLYAKAIFEMFKDVLPWTAEAFEKFQQ